jgi:hypothetical protein
MIRAVPLRAVVFWCAGVISVVAAAIVRLILTRPLGDFLQAEGYTKTVAKARKSDPVRSKKYLFISG